LDALPPQGGGGGVSLLDSSVDTPQRSAEVDPDDCLVALMTSGADGPPRQLPPQSLRRLVAAGEVREGSVEWRELREALRRHARLVGGAVPRSALVWTSMGDEGMVVESAAAAA